MVVGDVTTAVDLLILGAGPGGYVAAIRAAQLGRKVTLIDPGEPGGVCLHSNCIPLTALLTASERYAGLRDEALAAMGLTCEEVSFDWARMQNWKQGVIGRLSQGVRRLLKASGVECVRGTGWFLNDHEVRVEGEHGSLRYSFDACIIATGARAAEVPGLVYDGAQILTPEQALALPELPASLSIGGDGYLALELATLFARLGVRVSLHIPGPQLLPGLDPAALRVLQAGLRRLGIALSISSDLVGVPERPLLLALPAIPRVSDLHLEHANLQLAPDGGIMVDSQQRAIPIASVPSASPSNIFAVGDCATGGPQLASRAIRQGQVAAEVIAGQRVQYAPLVLPRVIRTTPEIALVSLPSTPEVTSEPLIGGRFPMAANGLGQALGADNGFALLQASPDGLLHSATLVGPHAGDLLGQLTLALEMGATLADLSELMYAHPGLGEIILEAAEQAQGKAIHTGNKG